MIGRLAVRHEPARDEAGFSLIELIVATGIMLMISGIITSAVVSMMSQTRRESGLSDNLDSARKIFQNLDKTARFANAITTPGTGTDGGSYVEYQTLSVSFKTTHGGGPAISQTNQATYTAINTTSTTVTSVCTEVGRP